MLETFRLQAGWNGVKSTEKLGRFCLQLSFRRNKQAINFGAIWHFDTAWHFGNLWRT